MKYEVETQQLAYDEQANVRNAAEMTRGLIATWRSRFNVGEADPSVAKNYGNVAVASDRPGQVSARIVTPDRSLTYEFDADTGQVSLDVEKVDAAAPDMPPPEAVAMLDGLSRVLFDCDSAERRGAK